MKSILVLLVLITTLICKSAPLATVAFTTDPSFLTNPPQAYVYGDGSGLTNILPRGMIVMWSGSLTNFDTDGHGTNSQMIGWQLCNGSNGAPDLRSMFIKGWAQGVDPLGTGGGPYTPAGAVAAPTIIGSTASEASHTHSVTASGTVTITNSTTGVTVAMSGSTAAEASHTHSVTAAGTTTISNFTPAGTISAPTISGSTATEASHTHSFTPAGFTTISNFTPAGTISTPTFTGTAPTVTNVQTIALVTGSRQVATNGAATPAGTVSTPTFTGTSTTTSNSFAGTAGTTGAGSSHSHGVGTLAASAPTFAGAAMTTSNSFVGSAVTSGAGSSHLHAVGTLAAGVTDNGHGHTNSFSGSAVTSGAGSSHSHSAGTLAASSPAFTGTQSTVEPAYVKLAFIIKL